ncbi:G-type lectin S-receptor-like serine/threonine-protein kinase SD1-13 isoform X2 [Chenopodium quinoa]|uniref:G-type lectin S-receptor-like serine/threonine-protein kinase SD1-13 isoform X2 n=1 Tax=Chenopodium quinoa TaxID=63459 RepID=UPI000B783F04|nr:G-type lectin S-receptor-like serine/threonine-protein kinase SD1-13 isoform X2 [Chenopodium quinoa]
MMVFLQILKDPKTMVSSNGDFKLGFFTLPNTKNRYLGIWYNKVSAMDYIWVANRNNPLYDSSGVLRISEEGNLQVLSGGKDVLWSSNISSEFASGTSRVVHLSDSGDLVLLELSTNSSCKDGITVWQSFDHPTNSILPNMKLSMSSFNMKHALQSWKSPSNPSYGRFSLGIDSLTHPQIVIWEGDHPYWRSGPWNGNIFLGLLYSDPSNNYADTYMQQTNKEEVDLVYTGINKLSFSHYAFEVDGSINEVWWDSGIRQWQTVYKAPDVECDFYGKCGAFGTCNPLKSPMCRCLRGFKPKNAEQWSKGNWSSGCVRKMPLRCGTETTQDGFLMLRMVKLPDHAEWLTGLNPNECRSQCLKNCSCLAYTYDYGAGCLYWSKHLIDIQEFSIGGVDLYLRLAESELGSKHKHKAVIYGAIISGATLIVLLICFLWRWLIKPKENRRKIRENIKFKYDRRSAELKDLPLFDFETLIVATRNFHESQKLGYGGFGQVYKGILKDGQEMAVKRLSTVYGQGLEEFMNEVVVISRLQHVNLVRLLGFCIEGEEKMLIYEYMPNGSLDAFLFNPAKRQLLDWSKRFNIIEGICRGLLYLHRDSRLRIIHRDLKPSNILLDKELNPKISDFGMARIFGHGQDQEETRRIVGTYGYMSPEYAMEGHFSEKSDVYSFGVLLLEIVTGKRSSTFWFEEQSLTLIGYVWKLWIEGNVAPAVDSVVSHPNFRKETEKCIQVGLLCVQEYVNDRPNISTVISMLTSDIEDLPSPKQPGFIKRLAATGTESYQSQQSSSVNDMSITGLIAR